MGNVPPVPLGAGQAPPTRGLPAKREAIMDAALRVFVRQGFAATSLEDIAAEAHVSRQRCPCPCAPSTSTGPPRPAGPPPAGPVLSPAR